MMFVNVLELVEFSGAFTKQQLIDRIECPVYHTLDIKQFKDGCEQFHIQSFLDEDMEYNHTRSRSPIVIYADYNADEVPIEETEADPKNCGTSSSSVLTEESRGLDINFYVRTLLSIFTKGAYQFNDEEMDLEYDCDVDICNLLKSMLLRWRNPIIHERPSLNYVLNHYCLYGSSKRVEFIKDAGDVIQRLPQFCKDDIDNSYTFINSINNWSCFFTIDLMKHMFRKTRIKYNLFGVCELMRFMRNLITHIQDGQIPEEHILIIGTNNQDMESTVRQKFPGLMDTIYEKLEAHLPTLRQILPIDTPILKYYEHIQT